MSKKIWWILQKINPKKVVTTYLAADEILEQVKPVKILHGKEFLLYVGRALPHKNLGRLIETFAMLKKGRPNLFLVLAGKRDKTYNKYLDEARKLGVADSVIFTGYVTEAELKWLYRSCRVYVFPSLSEGFGLPGLEAMIHRAPVASSTATCLPEIYGSAAWYFNPQDKFDMERTIKEVLYNKELRNKLIRAGREQAAKYSWERMARQTLKVYEIALKK